MTQGTFADFTSWPKYLVGSGPGPAPHLNGDRYAFINKVPPSGSTTFPDCTIIVKQTYPPDAGVPLPTLYGMVKVGGQYNATGALGWEWYELTQVYPNELEYEILWDAPAPPPGCGYGGTLPDGGPAPNTNCNACHISGESNDYVLGDALQLSSF